MVNTPYLIDTNKLLIETWNVEHPKPDDQQPLGVRRPEIDSIIPMVEEYDRSNMKLEDFIRKSAYVMAIVSWVQPFLDGNKRTGIIAGTKFLYDNGLVLDIEKKDEPELRASLYDIQDLRTSLDHSVVTKIIIYTTKRIHKHESIR